MKVLALILALTTSGFSQTLKPVQMPKPPADTRKPLTVQPVHLGAVPKPVAGPKPQPVTLRHAVRSVAVVASTTKP